MFDIQKKSVDSSKQLIANLGFFSFFTISFDRFLLQLLWRLYEPQ